MKNDARQQVYESAIVWVQGHEMTARDVRWVGDTVSFVGECTAHACNDGIRKTGYNGARYQGNSLVYVKMIPTPRTYLDMMRDLVATVREREWMPGQVWCGDSRDPGCPECEAPTPVKEGEGHKPECATARLLVEAEAFLRVEAAGKIELP